MKRAVAVVITALLGVAACSSGPPPELSGYERTPNPQVGHLAIPEPDRGDFSFVAEDGHLLLVYFGYTHCPDVCPTTLTDVRQALAKIGSDQAERVDLAMITIDPARDTDEVITGYVTSFVERAHGLRTDDADRLRSVADGFGADYSVVPVEGGEPEVGHTASLYAINSAGEMILTWPFGVSSDAIASDLEVLLDR